METILKEYSGKNILVTGGAGFIGLNLVKTLKEGGAHLTVTSLKKDKLDSKGKEILKNITVAFLDVRDSAALKKVVGGKDYIFHLAAHSGATDSMRNPSLDMEVNCLGTLNLLEACRLFSREAVILSLGSRLQFGRARSLPVDETHPFAPTSVHGVNKILAEKYFVLYNRLYDMKTVYFRVTNPYGPYQKKESKDFGIINFFIRKALLDEAIEIFGEGAQLRDYIYIDDLVEAMLRAPLVEEAYGDVFNIGSGRGVGLIDMVKSVIEISGSGSFKKIPWPGEFKKVETGDFIADIRKAGRILRWKPETALEQGLKKTIREYR